MTDLRTIYKAGVAKGASYKPGDVFLGAIPEAEKFGVATELERAVYLHGYLANLASPIVTTVDNVIISIRGVG